MYRRNWTAQAVLPGVKFDNATAGYLVSCFSLGLSDLRLLSLDTDILILQSEVGSNFTWRSHHVGKRSFCYLCFVWIRPTLSWFGGIKTPESRARRLLSVSNKVMGTLFTGRNRESGGRPR
ncbi:hypothetical protein PM082_021384 [Marasmius tenuissimus]|nr:hypothetical protein PM082_021384 [Marasmius tenuissimus]